jgi:hypothetical protein
VGEKRFAATQAVLTVQESGLRRRQAPGSPPQRLVLERDSLTLHCVNCDVETWARREGLGSVKLDHSSAMGFTVVAELSAKDPDMRKLRLAALLNPV